MLLICFLPSTTLSQSYKIYDITFIGFFWFYLIFPKTLTSMEDLGNMVLTDHHLFSLLQMKLWGSNWDLGLSSVSLASWVWLSCPVDKCSNVLIIVSLVQFQDDILSNLSLAQDNYPVHCSLKAIESSSYKHSFLNSLHPPQLVLLLSHCMHGY